MGVAVMSNTNSPLFFNSKILYLPVSHNTFHFDFFFFLICNATNKCYFFVMQISALHKRLSILYWLIYMVYRLFTLVRWSGKNGNHTFVKLDMFLCLCKSRFKVFVFLLLLTVLCLLLKIRSVLLSFHFQYVCLVFPINYIFRKTEQTPWG